MDERVAYWVAACDQMQFAFFHSSVAAGLLAPTYIMHFSNLLVLASTAVLAVAAPSTGLMKRVKTFKFFGVNESGAEFGNTAIPGQLGKDYTWPLTYFPLHLLLCPAFSSYNLQFHDRYPRRQGLKHIP